MTMTKSVVLDPLLTEGILSQPKNRLSPKKKATLYIGTLWAETRNELRPGHISHILDKFSCRVKLRWRQSWA